MKKSVMIMIGGGIIFAAGFIILSFVAQSAVSEIRKMEYTLGPMEVIEIKSPIETSEFFSGVYAIEVLEAGDRPIRVNVRDPDGMQLISKEFTAPFVIESFDVKKDGLYVMTIENTSAGDIIKIAAALGGQVYAGAADPMVAVAVPSYILITGIIIVIAGFIVYYRERTTSR
jgi:ABC-type antimicrobial peptide transport system permease subunit